jgi:hypothetical protein
MEHPVNETTHPPTHSLRPRSRVLEKKRVLLIVNKFAEFCGHRRFITAFTRACHVFILWDKSIQSIACQSIFLRSILILSHHLRLYDRSDNNTKTNTQVFWSMTPYRLINSHQSTVRNPPEELNPHQHH